MTALTDTVSWLLVSLDNGKVNNIRCTDCCDFGKCLLLEARGGGVGEGGGGCAWRVGAGAVGCGGAGIAGRVHKFLRFFLYLEAFTAE